MWVFTHKHTNTHTETHFFMLKKDHRRRGVPSPGSPTQCVPVHFHHVVPAEHGVAFSPALWDASLFSHRVFVCARACRATLSRAFVISLFQGLQHGLAIKPHCGHLGWIQTGDSTRIPPLQPPKAHLSDRAGLPSGLPRSPSLLQLSFLSYSFSRLTKCPWQNRDGSTVDSPSCPPSSSSTSSNKLPANLRNFLFWSFAEVLWKCPPLCMFTGQIMKPDRIL